MITFSVSGQGQFSNDLTSIDKTTDSNGQATADLSSSSTGTSTIQASFDGTVAETSVTATSNDATKDWFEPKARITMDADSTNALGDTHTFEATLEIDSDGDGTYETTPQGEDLNFNISGTGTSIVNETTTDSNGVATVEVDASTPGTYTVTADWSGEVANVTVDATQGSADKTWVDGYITITPGEAVNQLGEDHPFTITAYAEGGTPTGWSITPSVSPTPDSESDTCANPTVAGDGMSASCTVTINHNSTETFTASATADLTYDADTTVTVSTDGTGESSEEATKDYVDYRLLLTPPSATNEVGVEHTFTATLQKTVDGQNWSPVEGASIDFSWSGLLDGTDSEPTNSSGQASVTLTGNSPGEVTMEAAFNGSIGDVETVSLDADDAEKTWIDLRINLIPESATNVINDEHIFTATLEVNDGNGWSPVEGKSITFNITNGPGEFTNGTDTISGLTNGSGKATATLTSAITGTTTVEASFNGRVSDVLFDITSNQAEKDWIEADAKLTLTPKGDTNAVGVTHTFTALLEFDTDGDGTFETLGTNETVTFTISGAGTPSGDQEVTTDSNGEAKIDVDSNVPGITNVVVNWNGTINGEGNTVTAAPDSTTKTWVDARLSLTPTEDSNAIGDDHTFDALLEFNYGSGWTTAGSGETVQFDITGGVGQFSNGLDSITATTNGSGVASVILNSSSTGTSTVQASFNGTVSEQSVSTTSNEATKDWFRPAARLSITPEGATNEVGITHTFTALLEIDNNGDGNYDLAPDGTEVDFSLTGEGTLSDETTTVNGEATIDLDSAVPGSSTVTANWSGTVANVTVTATPDSGEKTWVDARLSLSPETGTNVVGDDHELTVFLEINDGTGGSPGADETVTLEILEGPGEFTNESNIILVTTDENGEAIAILTSDTEGTTTVQASFDGTVADQSITRTSNEAEKDWESGLMAENLEATICDNTNANLTLRALGSNIDRDENPITFTINSSPAKGMVTGDFGDVTYPDVGNEATVTVTYSPAEDDTGEYSFTYRVEDNTGEWDIGRVTVTIVPCGPEEAGGAGGLEEDIVINEMAWSGTKADSTHEWIELFNDSDKEVDLTGWTLRWRKDKTKEWKEVRLKGTIQAEDYYILERLSDETISDLKANLIYDAEKPHKLPLLDEGEVMQLLNSDGLIVDTANAEKPELGWPGGSVKPVNSMERIDPKIPDLRENWATNEGIIIKGKDRDVVDLTASALHINEKTLLARTFTGEPHLVELGSKLTFTVRQPADELEGAPRVLLASSSGSIAGGAGSVITGEGGALIAEAVPGLPNYLVTFDTSKVQPGIYKLFIVVDKRIIHKQAIKVTD